MKDDTTETNISNASDEILRIDEAYAAGGNDPTTFNTKPANDQALNRQLKKLKNRMFAKRNESVRTNSTDEANEKTSTSNKHVEF